MKRLIALLFALALLGACAAPAMVENDPTTTEQATTAAPAPREWSGVPQGYWAVLEHATGHAISSTTMGYSLVDINNDGVPELIILRWWSGFDEPSIAAIYTLDGDEPVYLRSFNDVRSSGRVAEDGTIYVTTYRWEFRTQSSFVLESHATELTRLTAWSIDNLSLDNPEEEPIWGYFRGTWDDRQPITAEEHYAATARYYSPPNPMQFDFIPLG